MGEGNNETQMVAFMYLQSTNYNNCLDYVLKLIKVIYVLYVQVSVAYFKTYEVQRIHESSSEHRLTLVLISLT